MPKKETESAFVVPEASAQSGLPDAQRVDIYLSAEYDLHLADWKAEHPDKAEYMNDEENRARAAAELNI